MDWWSRGAEAHMGRRVGPVQTWHLLQADHRKRHTCLAAGPLWRVDSEWSLVEARVGVVLGYPKGQNVTQTGVYSRGHSRGLGLHWDEGTPGGDRGTVTFLVLAMHVSLRVWVGKGQRVWSRAVLVHRETTPQLP